MGLRVLRGIHNLNTYGGLVASLIPTPITQAAGQAIFIGQGLADAEHDVREGNYGSAVANGAMMALPYGISKGYKYIRGLRPVNKFIKHGQVNPQQHYQNYKGQLINKQNNLKEDIIQFSNNHPDDAAESFTKLLTRADRRPIDWAQVQKDAKQMHTDYNNYLIEQRNPHTTINLNGQQVTVRPSVVYKTGETNPASPELAQYLNDIQTMLGDAGLVSGSTRLYGSGIVNGVPHDLEVITTKSRMGALKKAAGAEGAEYSSSNGFAQQLQGNNKVFNSDGGHMIDVQVLGEDANGFATGQIAHNWYSRMYPEEYQKLAKKWAEQATNAEATGARFVTTEQSLPIKTEDFYQQLQNDPDLITKMVALDNFNSNKAKHIARQAQMYQNSALVKDLQNRNLRATHPEWQDLQQLTPQEIQEARQVLKIPSAYSDEAVQEIVRQQFITDMIGIRGVFWNKQWLPQWNMKIENQALRSVVSPFNGQLSGIGGNQLLQASEPGVSSSIVASLNNNTLGINTYRQYVDFVKNKIKRGSPAYNEIDNINRSVANGSITIEDATKQIENISKRYGINGYYGDDYNGLYYGATTQPTIGIKMATIGEQSGKNNVLEVGSYPNFNLGYEGLGIGVAKKPIITHPMTNKWFIQRHAYPYNTEGYAYLRKYPEFRKMQQQKKAYHDMVNQMDVKYNDFYNKLDKLNRHYHNLQTLYKRSLVPATFGGMYTFVNPIVTQPDYHRNNAMYRQLTLEAQQQNAAQQTKLKNKQNVDNRK